MEVSKSGYCEYIRRRKSNARIERGALEGFVKDAFGRHRAGCGYRRINQELRKMDISVGGKSVLRIMRRLGLAAEGATGKRRKQKAVEPGDSRLNILERVFSVGEKDKLCMGGIACIPTKEGWLYPACAIDAFPRKAVGWPMPERITEKLAVDAIGQAVGRGNPSNDGRPVFRNDQGARYASRAFQGCLDSHGITQSVSRPGTPLDSAVAESSFKTPKREPMKGKDCKTREEAARDIFKCIELYCNTVRMHSALDYDSPVDCERRYA